MCVRVSVGAIWMSPQAALRCAVVALLVLVPWPAESAAEAYGAESATEPSETDPGNPRNDTEQRTAPRVSNITVESLSNPGGDWGVQTRVLLAAETQGLEAVTFMVKALPLHGVLECPKELITTGMTGERNRLFVIYTPDPGFEGQDRFTYAAVQNEVASQPGTVTINVRGGGLRWEVLTGGSSGLSSGGLEESGSTLGGSLTGLQVTLNWQVAQGRRKAELVGSVPSGKEEEIFKPATSFIQQKGTAGAKGGQGWNANVSFTTGIVPRARASQLKEVQVADAGTASGAEKADTAVTYDRAFTSSGGIGINLVRSVDGKGGFAEFGLIGRAQLDVFIDGDKVTEKDGVTYITIDPAEQGRSFWNAEVGFRFALKRSGENPNSLLTKKEGSETVERYFAARNLEELLVLEAVYRRANSFGALAPRGDSESTATDPRNRFAFRMFAMPKIPGVGPTARPLLGVDYSQDFDQGTKDVRIFYGVNVSLGRLF